MQDAQENLIKIYFDKFEFVTIKKYLGLVGPITCLTVHDHMYPILKFQDKLIIEKPDSPHKYGDILAIWDEDRIHFGLFCELNDENQIILKFVKVGNTKSFPASHLLGKVTNIKVPIKYRMKWITLLKRS